MTEQQERQRMAKDSLGRVIARAFGEDPNQERPPVLPSTDLQMLEVYARRLASVSAKRCEAAVLDAFIACTEAEAALRKAERETAIADHLRSGIPDGVVFGRLLELEIGHPAQFTWEQEEHLILGTRYIGRRAGGFGALVYQPRHGVEAWRWWAVNLSVAWREQGEVFSPLEGAAAAEVALAARLEGAAK